MIREQATVFSFDLDELWFSPYHLDQHMEPLAHYFGLHGLISRDMIIDTFLQMELHDQQYLDLSRGFDLMDQSPILVEHLGRHQGLHPSRTWLFHNISRNIPVDKTSQPTLFKRLDRRIHLFVIEPHQRY